MRAPLMWYGGKGRMRKKLLSIVPKHDYYCEVFGGGASLLFAKAPAPKMEVYNDIDEGLYTFFSVLRDPDKFAELQRLIELTPYSRVEWRHARKRYMRKEWRDDIERAYLFFIIARQSFSGTFASSYSYAILASRRHMSAAVSRYLSIIKELPEIHKRLRTVQIEGLPWKECAEKYNRWGRSGLYYMDPPYVLSTLRNKPTYVSLMSDGEHAELDARLLNECDVKVMLSGYDNKIYAKLDEHGWHRHEFRVRTSVNNITTTKSERVECVWTNFEEQQTLIVD